MMHEAIRGKTGSFAVLDVGTTKVTCFTGMITPQGEVRVKGVGHQLAKGMRSGVIVDSGEVQTSIIAAVHAAEQMAGETIEHVVVSVGGTNMKSRSVSVELEVVNDGVRDEDIVDLIQEGCHSLEDEEHRIVHAFPIQYYLDQARGLTDPRGMLGNLLGTELNIITAKDTYLRNLVHCVAKCHLNVDGYILSPHASGLAVLSEDEMELGVTVIEMGGGLTSMAVFCNGKNIFADAIPIGGLHVTKDIAHGLSTSLAQAERLKTIHGSAVSSVKDSDVMIEVPILGEDEDEDEANLMPRSMLVGVVRPRMEELFELVRSRLEAAGVDKAAGRRCVLTGGASQMLGVADLSARILSKQVRKGKPHAIPGMADFASGPAYATPMGMMHFLAQKHWEDNLLQGAEPSSGISRASEKIMRWLKANV